MQHGPDQTSTTGQLLHLTIEYHALEVGMSGDPLSLLTVTYTTKHTWISHTIASLHGFKITLHSDIPGLHSWCDNNIFIMERLNSKLPASALAIINKVCLYLHVNKLSDLVSADGAHYDRSMLKGIHNKVNPQPSYHAYIWPNVDKPTATEREIWTKIICEQFDIDLHTGQGGAARRIKGWKPNAINNSLWAFSSDTGLVYERYENSNRWRMWKNRTTQA
jgi:hypothetical protein